jgi:hypothetical protein
MPAETRHRLVYHRFRDEELLKSLVHEGLRAGRCAVRNAIGTEAGHTGA